MIAIYLANGLFDALRQIGFPIQIAIKNSIYGSSCVYNFEELRKKMFFFPSDRL